VLPDGSVSPGVADASARPCVLMTALIQDGRASPFALAKLRAI
jgi:hypothetical protein